jgi:hypothetical protein
LGEKKNEESIRVCFFLCHRRKFLEKMEEDEEMQEEEVQQQLLPYRKPYLREITRLETKDDFEAAVVEIEEMIPYTDRISVISAVESRELLFAAHRIYDPSSNITYEEANDQSVVRGIYYCLFSQGYFTEYLSGMYVLEKLKPYLHEANKRYMFYLLRGNNANRQFTNQLEYAKIVMKIWSVLYAKILNDEGLYHPGHTRWCRDLHNAVVMIKIYPTDARIKVYDDLLTPEIVMKYWSELLQLEVAIHELRIVAGFVTENTKITPNLLYIAHLYIIPWRNLLAAYKIYTDGRLGDVTPTRVPVIDFQVKFFLFVLKHAGLVGARDSDETEPMSLFRISLSTIFQNKLNTSKLEGHEELKGSIFEVEKYLLAHSIHT